jgi:FkbM family methyltransferase
MLNSQFLKPVKKHVLHILRKAGFHVIANTEYERLIMRDNLAGLLSRGVAAVHALSPDELNFLKTVAEFNGITQSQLFQDLFALQVSSQKRNGYFVEVGVGDGVTHSNTRLLELEQGWSGLLIEPNFALWDTIRQSRNTTLVQCAASESKGELVFNRVATAELSFVGNDVPNDNLHRTVLESRVVKAKTLDEILSEHRAPEGLDYLSIDVEGHELEVLGGFDAQRWRPKAITIEYNNDDDRADAIRERLPGYRQIMSSLSGCDLWFVRD